MEVLNLINGGHDPAVGGEWLDLIDPSKGKSYGRIPRSGAEDVEKAVSAANYAFENWSSWSAESIAWLRSAKTKVCSNSATVLRSMDDPTRT